MAQQNNQGNQNNQPTNQQNNQQDNRQKRVQPDIEGQNLEEVREVNRNDIREHKGNLEDDKDLEGTDQKGRNRDERQDERREERKVS